jgi:lipopolysaccharide export system permease protein
MGVVLMAFSLALFGFVQPYSRYAYRAVMHAAQNAGWSGELPGGMIVSTGDDFVITADADTAQGPVLHRLFVRQLDDEKQEFITTAREAEIKVDRASNTATLLLREGNQLRLTHNSEPALLRFSSSSIEVPLGTVAKLLRDRGRDERELTSIELLEEAAKPDSPISYGALMAEFYGRLARTLSLPLLPLLAIPLALAGKRSGRASGAIIAGIILVGFQHLLQLGEGMAEEGSVSPLLGVGLPFFVFAALCIWIFMSSRKRPGDTPISRAAEALDGFLRYLGSLLKSFRQVSR